MVNRWPSGHMLGVAAVTSLAGSFHFGYQLTMTNPAQDAFLNFLNQTLGARFKDGLSDTTIENIWSFVVAIMFLGALAGSFSIRFIAEKIGRKRGLYISIGAGVISCLMAIGSKYVSLFELFIVSRILMGWSVSVNLGLSAIFLSEASPKECRGAIGMVTGTSVQFGTVCGSIVAMPQLLGTDTLWPFIYAVEIVIIVVFAVSLPFLPESPGYLVQIGDHDAACTSIQYYFKCSQNKANTYLYEIKEEQKQNTRRFTMMDVVKKRSLRSKAIIGVVVTFAMSFSGVAVINAYAFEILKDTGLSVLEASFANVGIAIVSMIGCMVASLVIDKFGRRPMLLVAFTGILFCNIVIVALMYTFDSYGYHVLGFLLIFFICVFIVFFAIGPGPLSFFINAELVGQAARSASQSWASVVQMLSRFALVTAFLPMKNQIGEAWAYAILFIVPVAVSIIYLYFSLPETKNKDAKQVAEAINNLPRFPLCRKDKIDTEMETFDDYDKFQTNVTRTDRYGTFNSYDDILKGVVRAS